MTRPSVPVAYQVVDDDGPTPNRLLLASPWIALLALAAGAAGVVLGVVNRGADLSACRSAAWAAIPDKNDLPDNWTLGSTDLNANGMTVSIMGPASPDDSTNQPVVYASVTCYGDVAATAMQQNRDAAKAAGSTVIDRSSAGDAYDVENPSTGSITTLFRVGQLIGQIAGAGSADDPDLATITSALAAAMGNGTAAGDAGPQPSHVATGSEEPGASNAGSEEPGSSEPVSVLEAAMPTSIQGTPLTSDSATGDQGLLGDPASRALAARLVNLGANLDDLEVSRALDYTNTLDIAVYGFRLPGFDTEKLKTAVLEAWLGSKGPGVKQTTVTLGGKRLIKIDAGTQGPLDYVYATSDHVIVIDTADPAAAEEAAGQIR